MTRPFQHWKVLPHGRLTEVGENILTVTGRISMPLMELERRMTVVRLGAGGLIIFSAIALDEDQMKTLEAFGRPAFMIVPSDKHRLDSRIWKERYPSMQVVTPAGARSSVEAIVPVDTTEPNFDDPSVRFVTVPGTRARDAALVIRGSTGTTLLLNDVVGNLGDVPGIGGWFLRVAGFAGKKPQIPRVVKMATIDDQAALRAQLLQWAELDGLKRILVSHGAPIVAHPQQTLRELASSLT